MNSPIFNFKDEEGVVANYCLFAWRSGKFRSLSAAKASARFQIKKFRVIPQRSARSIDA